MSVGDYAHLPMLRPSYQAKIKAAANSQEPRLIWFFWRDASGLFDETLKFLVFDESDELSLPNAERSASWKARASKAYKIATNFYFEPTMPDEAQHLFGHYHTIMVNV